ncbi:MAG: caspase family protein [Desulfovibrionaceae bacterium]|nr:caspase family protein [Desulfovibrionaceae bacterium]
MRAGCEMMSTFVAGKLMLIASGVIMSEKYIIIIAIERYQDINIGNVKYAENDANSLKQTYLYHGVPVENIFMLVGENATKTRIESLFRRVLACLVEEDELVIFYAGHGFFEGYNFLTCYDSVKVDYRHTSIPINNILSDIKEAKCKKVSIFMDSCHSGLKVDESMRDLMSSMTDEEFKSFCAESEYYTAFSACASDEKSHSSPDLRHGIWSYHLIQALSGNDENALERGRFLTATSLQNYLSRNVKLTLRSTFTDIKRQTPQKWGNSSREFIVADLEQVLNAKRIASKTGFAKIENFSLITEFSGAVRRLSGFKSAHKVPKNVCSATSSFVKKIAAGELSTSLEEVFEELKSVFKFKRVDLKMNISVGEGTIVAPDFTFAISVDIDSDDPAKYVIRKEVCEVQNYDTLVGDNFAEVFDNCFDRVEFVFDKAVNIENIIDKVEDISKDGVKINYPADLSRCDLVIEGLGFYINVTPDSMNLIYDKKQAIGDIVKGVEAIPGICAKYQLVEVLSKRKAIGR